VSYRTNAVKAAVLIGARGRETIFTKADLTGIYAPAVALHHGFH
jgi:ribosomal protein L32E